MTDIAVLADIHANYRALQAVSEELAGWHPDRVYVLGDSINRGPRSKDCLAFLLRKQQHEGWHLLQGNHEEYVLRFEGEEVPRQGPEFEILRFVHWTYQRLSQSDIQQVKDFPARIDHHLPSGQQFRAVHASMAGNRTGIYPETPQERLPVLIRPAPDIFCAGHTHRPLIRQVESTRVINAGSVGLPFDGNPHPSYARVQTGSGRVDIDICRFEYDRKEALEDFYRTGFVDQAGPMVRIILEEFKTARPLISRWHDRYADAVRKETISLQASVDQFLNAVREESHHHQLS